MMMSSWKRRRKTVPSYQLAVFNARNHLVRKYAANQARIFSITKNMIMFQSPELKMGEGGGCMTLSAEAKITRSAMM
jgi:hypothetical protein